MNQDKTKTKKKLVIVNTPVQKIISISSDSKKNKKNKVKGNKTRKLIISEKPVIYLETGKEYENIKDIKIQSNINNMSSDIRLNEKYIEIMEKLSDIMLKQGEPFRARAYQKAQETIMTYTDDIIDPKQLKGLPNIGPTIMEKLNEYKETSTLKILEREKNNPINILTDVYGIGPKKAKELVESGITSIDDLRKNQDKLNDVQKVGLKYYEDILKRIPRSEIDEYVVIFSQEFKKVATMDENAQFEIVGSYRRGTETSGDIDVIITSKSSQVFTQFINKLVEQKIIIEILSRGSLKCLVIAKIPSSNTCRRVDFLYATPEEYPFSILYFTGSKTFNTVMRSRVLNMGLSMNEHGLFKMIKGEKSEKVSHVFKNEKDIFNYLHLQYKTPKERIDGRAVVVSGYDQIKLEKEKLSIPSQVIQMVNNFKHNGITVLDNLNEDQLSTILVEANKAYYNETPLMSDNEFDIVKEYIKQKYPNNSIVKEIGAPIEKNKVVLPYQMWSMDKIKPDTEALVNWCKLYSGPYIISCKLDGVSALYSTEKEPKLYTRGNGKVGQDISYLIPYLRLPKNKGIVLRGEIIIPKSVFDSKYKGTFANPRNMVSGAVNQKTITDVTKDLHFVAYELIQPIKKPLDQLEFIQKHVECVLYKLENHISNDILSQILIEWRKSYTYEIDGIIVTDNKIYPRKSGNPEHAFAFKMVLSDQIAEAKVVDVIWTPSKDGYLKPRVRIEPIQLSGVRIEYATGFNAAFINDNKIGVGSIIEIIRSGDVIPYIRKVLVPAEQAKMPSIPYKWNSTHIDIMLEDKESDETVIEKNITGFFRGIGVEGLSSGNITRIIHTGYDTIPKIINMTVNDLLKVDGFKIKTATKIYEGIKEKLQLASLVVLMSASNVFGRGFSDKKIELIMENYPNVLLSDISNLEKVKMIVQIKGIAELSAKAFVEKIPDFIQFMHECGLNNKLQVSYEKEKHDISNPLYGKSIVITGFRDAVLQEKLKNIGVKMGSSVSKNTFMVLVKDTNGMDTSKAIEAQKIGIPIMIRDDFVNKYL